MIGMSALLSTTMGNMKETIELLKEKGLHSQKSVFECDMDPATLRSALRFLRRQELGDRDSIVLYPLCARCARKGRILGQGLRLERTDWIII